MEVRSATCSRCIPAEEKFRCNKNYRRFLCEKYIRESTVHKTEGANITIFYLRRITCHFVKNIGEGFRVHSAGQSIRFCNGGVSVKIMVLLYLQ